MRVVWTALATVAAAARGQQRATDGRAAATAQSRRHPPTNAGTQAPHDAAAVAAGCARGCELGDSRQRAVVTATTVGDRARIAATAR